MRIGSHVQMKAPEYIEGSVKEMLSYNANAMMLYTGAPQNTLRKAVNELHVEQAKQLLAEHGLSMNDVVVHAPYIINLGNVEKEETFRLGVDFLKKEIERVEEIGAGILFLHPGSFTKATPQAGIRRIIDGLNEVLSDGQTVRIALETMAGKGSEVGRTLEELKEIIDGVKKNELLGICLDTCHLHDSGYDVSNVDALLDDVDRIIGLDRVLAMHINDSKNVRGARKDRHENIGYGEIGFETLCDIVHNPRTEHIIKILETPYVNEKPPYKQEIENLRNRTFTDVK